MPSPKSPAVASLENERSSQHGQTDALSKGLEDTFPASDPVSPSATTTAGGTAQAAAGSTAFGQSDAPRVDDALHAILDHRNDPYVEPREQVAALRDEADSLRYRVLNALDDVKRDVQRRPLRAVGIAALVGFVFGMTR